MKNGGRNIIHTFRHGYEMDVRTFRSMAKIVAKHKFAESEEECENFTHMIAGFAVYHNIDIDEFNKIFCVQ